MAGYGYPVMIVLVLLCLAGSALTLWLPLLPISMRAKNWIKYLTIVMVVFYSSVILYRAYTRTPVQIRSIR